MILIGCTGGIGSGKSTVASLLQRRGAVVVDADAIARVVIEPGGRGHEAVLERFGTVIAAPDGSIDRPALAAVVFADESARRDLEAIVHPVVQAEILDRLEDHRASGEVVVLDLPLLVETNARERYGLDGVLVVDAPEELAIDRVVERRSTDRESVRSRLRAQIDPATRLQAADFIIMNHGSLHELDEMVDLAWEWIERLADERGEPLD